MPFSICRPILPRVRDTITPTTAPSLAVINRAIEDLLLQHIPQADLAVGLQRFSNFLPLAARYRSLAAAGARIWVCGRPDITPVPIEGITFVALSDDWPVAREWFMVANAPSFGAALIAEELSLGMPGMERHFNAYFSTEQAMVELAGDLLAAMLGVRWRPQARRDVAAQQRHLAFVTRRLIHYQQEQAARSARERQVELGAPASLEDQVRELDALCAKISRLDGQSEWQQILLAHTRRVTSRLITSMS